MRRSKVLPRIAATFTMAAMFCCSRGVAQEVTREAFVPNMVIYPGETLRPEAIKKVMVYISIHREPPVSSVNDILGKIAVVTLLPNEPIIQRMLRRPSAIKIGATVSIKYDRPGVSISTSGTALQGGAIGERIRVKNLDSSAILVGVVQDGDTVQVTD